MTNIQYAYARYASERFPLPTEAQLSALERQIEVQFPPDFREYVLEYNGGKFRNPEISPVGSGCPSEGLHVMYGIDAGVPSVELGTPWHLSLFDGNSPPRIVPIGITGTGSLIILGVEEDNYGQIFLKQAFGEFFYLADDIDEFFAQLSD